MRYAHQRCKATARSSPIRVPRKPTTISGPWTSTNWLLGIGKSQPIRAKPAQSPVKSEIPARAIRTNLCRFELMPIEHLGRLCRKTLSEAFDPAQVERRLSMHASPTEIYFMPRAFSHSQTTSLSTTTTPRTSIMSRVVADKAGLSILALPLVAFVNFQIVLDPRQRCDGVRKTQCSQAKQNHMVDLLRRGARLERPAGV